MSALGGSGHDQFLSPLLRLRRTLWVVRVKKAAHYFRLECPVRSGHRAWPSPLSDNIPTKCNFRVRGIVENMHLHWKSLIAFSDKLKRGVLKRNDVVH